MKREDLKIQFRAVQHGCHSLALQYRIDPEDTNNQYTQVKSRFFGLIKRVVTKSFSCDWNTVRYFVGWAEYHEPSAHTNWQPIWIKNQKDLDYYKHTFKTIGAFENHIAEIEKKNREEYNIKRQNYLYRMKPMY